MYIYTRNYGLAIASPQFRPQPFRSSVPARIFIYAHNICMSKQYTPLGPLGTHWAHSGDLLGSLDVSGSQCAPSWESWDSHGMVLGHQVMRQIWKQNMPSRKLASSLFLPLGLAEGKVMRQIRKQKIPSPQVFLITFPSAGSGGGKSYDSNLGAEDAISPHVPHQVPFRCAWRKEP